MLRILIRNIISNWCGFVVYAAVAFFLTPFVLHSLGEERYGIWALVTGLTGYYGLLDLGFRSGITQYLTRHLATRNFEEMNRVASTAVAALGACGGLIMMIAGILCWLAPHVFEIPSEAIAETRWCILIIGSSTAVSFLFFTFSAVFAATQRYDISNSISITIRLITAAAMVGSLEWGFGLVSLSIVIAAGDILGYILRTRVAFWILPELKISWRYIALDNLWSLTTFGVWSFLSQCADQLRTYSSIFIIGIFLPIAALAPFSLANGLVFYFDAIFSSVAVVFFPAATHLDARGDAAMLKQMYLVGSKMLVLSGIGVGLIGAIWAADFFRLWVGNHMVGGGKYPSIAILFWLLLAAAIIITGQKIGLQIFLGCRLLKSLTILLATEALLNVILSVCLVHFYGLIGAALGILIPAALFQGILQPAALCRYLKISPITYIRQVYVRPILAGVAIFLCLKLIHSSMPSADGWSSLFFHGAIAASVTAAIMLAIGLDNDERQQFLFEPFRRLKTRLSRYNIPNA
jgi:O-antigen/teichoic acid export membrane protein